MGRKSKTIENLSSAQKSALQKGYAHGKSPIFRRKCHCILLSNTGKSVKELSIIFGISETSIRKWLRQWEQEGIDGLHLKPGRGRKPKLDLNNAVHTSKVKTLVENEPKNINKVKAEIESSFGIQMCKRTLTRFLKNFDTYGNAFVSG